MLNFKALIRPLLSVALPVVVAACGSSGSSADGGDMATTSAMDMATSSADGAACATPAFTVASGTYTISNATVTNDTCGTMADPTITAAMLNGTTRSVTESDGMITVSGSSTGTANLGSGADMCNMGTLTLSSTSVMPSATCSYDITRSSTLDVTANNTFTLMFTEDRTNVTAGCDEQGNGTCSVSFTITLSM